MVIGDREHKAGESGIEDGNDSDWMWGWWDQKKTLMNTQKKTLKTDEEEDHQTEDFRKGIIQVSNKVSITGLSLYMQARPDDD